MIKNKKILIIGGTGALGKTLTKRYYDDNQIIVEVNKGYQCPSHCKIDHHHSVYFTGNGMTIDEEQLGSRYREKKNHRKK